MTERTEETPIKRRQALGAGFKDIDAALEPVGEGTAGHGQRAYFNLPFWGPYVDDEQYEQEKFAYETAIGRAGCMTTASVVELSRPAVIDLTTPSDAGTLQTFE